MAKWTNYFSRLEGHATDQDIADALDYAKALTLKMDSMGQELRAAALYGQQILFKPNEEFFDILTHTGQLELVEHVFNRSSLTL